MEKIWKIKESSREFPKELEKKFNPLVLRILFNRGVREASEIEKFFLFDYVNDLSNSSEFLGMEKAVDRIALAKKSGEKIAIFGDYDADGVSASAVLHETFGLLGFSEPVCYIPDRQLEGYGMNEKAVEYLAGQGVKLIITVDCGITNRKEVARARELGMDVIITDHHSVPDELPEALVCINPHIPTSGFPFSDLAGVGVAFKLAEAICRKIDPGKIESMKWLLDLVAIGTIADCVPLLGENRVLVKYGLLVLSKTKRVGMREIFQVGRIDISENNIPDTQKVAFQIAPRINAAGRMDHANISYQLLIEKDIAKARVMALELESKNQNRQKITTEIFREVQALSQKSFQDKKFIFAESEVWPVGILGLVAGKITEEFQKPTAIFQKKGDELSGSFRSIPEVNIMQMIRGCSDLLLRFGGHSQAAGVSLKTENSQKFYARMSELIEKELLGKEIVPTLEVDVEIAAEDIDWDLLNDLKKMEPFGQGNAEPVFCARSMFVSEARIIGNGQKHWKLAIRPDKDSPKIFDAVGFSMVEKFPNLKSGDIIDTVFNLSEDEWNGNKKIQMKLIDLRIVE
jgi:single-stranded-DNA-specific exonuclease